MGIRITLFRWTLDGRASIASAVILNDQNGISISLGWLRSSLGNGQRVIGDGREIQIAPDRPWFCSTATPLLLIPRDVAPLFRNDLAPLFRKLVAP